MRLRCIYSLPERAVTPLPERAMMGTLRGGRMTVVMAATHRGRILFLQLGAKIVPGEGTTLRIIRPVTGRRS